MCCASGRKALMIENKYKDAIRPCFSAQVKTTSPLIRDGYVVIRLSPEELDGAAEGSDSASEDLWYHVGLHYFKPVRSTFLKLVLDGGHRPDAAASHNPLVTLKATSQVDPRQELGSRGHVSRWPCVIMICFYA